MKSDKESRLMEMLKESSGRVRAKEERVLKYLLENEDRLQDISISEIAEKADVSKATVVRFCKGLDFNGFKDFKVYYEAGKGLKFSSVPLLTGDEDPLKIASSLREGIGCVLERTFTKDNIALLSDIADEIRKNGEIKIVGFDDEYSHAEKLKKIIEKKYPEKNVYLNGDEENTSPFNILISFSGNDKRVMAFLTDAVLSGGSAYAFTAESSSLIAKAATKAFILPDNVIYSAESYMLTCLALSSVLSALEIMLGRTV